MCTTCFAQCPDQTGTVDSVYTNCIAPKLKAAKAEVRKEIRTTLAWLKTNPMTKDLVGHEHLARSQQNWQRHVESYCDLVSITVNGGQRQRLIPEGECLIEMYEARAAELRSLRKASQ
jgi:uncharacterized protein YecT (DUF1311 family)